MRKYNKTQMIISKRIRINTNPIQFQFDAGSIKPNPVASVWLSRLPFKWSCVLRWHSKVIMAFTLASLISHRVGLKFRKHFARMT